MTIPEFPSEEYQLLDSLKDLLNFSPTTRFPEGIGDDAAMRRCSPDEQLIFTGDTLVEQVHFSFDYMTPQDVGYKAIVASISDCASMGAIPDSALVQLVFPAEKKGSKETVLQLYSGIGEACKKWNFPVVGGDLSLGPGWIIAVSLTGRKEAGARFMTRTDIKAGDDVWVTGVPGKSAAGLDLLKKWGRNSIPDKFQLFADCHLKPDARVEAGLALSEDSCVHACIDLSDGISKECYTLCYENGIGIALSPKEDDIACIFSELEQALAKPWYDWFLYGGEDYELLFTASEKFDPSKYENSTFYKIGKVTDNKNRVTINLNGTPVTVEKKAWDHFQR
jgi:thiamine-monophosphate kinase